LGIPKILTLFLVIQFINCSMAMADELRLKNGDRITGQVITMEKNKLVFKTAYAGEITLEWHEVANLTSQSPMTVKMGDSISLHGTAEPAPEGEMRVEQDPISESATFDLSQVTAINPVPEPAIKISARANVGLSDSSGNTDTRSVYLDGRFVARTDKNRTTVSVEYNREKSEGVTTVEYALGGLKYDQFFSEKWYAYAKVGLEKDKFKDLNLRTDIGAGPGYQVFESEQLNLGFEGGVSYVNQDFIDDKDEDYAAFRLAMDYDQYFYDKFFQLFFSNENLVRADDTKDIFSRLRTGVRVPVYKNLNLTGQYNLEWDNKPAPDTKKTDQTVIFSLGYSYD